MMQKIVLFFPVCRVKVFGSNEDVAKPEMAVAPPLGILYLARSLLDAGYHVECCDYNAERFTLEHLQKTVATADLVGVSVLSFNRSNAYELIRLINRLRPTLPVIAGGADCILHRQPVPGCVLTVIEEAETLIVDVVGAVLGRRGFAELQGVVFIDSAGRPCLGRPFSYVTDLDKIKFPSREFLRENKGYTVIGKRSRDVATIITSRGCPRHCAFCAHGAIAYRTYRRRSAENVLDEITMLYADGYKVLGIVDDNFTADIPRARAILEGIIERGIVMTIVVQGRVDGADLELYRLMRRAGVKGITFGLQSGTQEVLDFYRKGTTVAMNERAVRMADRAGLYTGGIFIFGAPLETIDQFKATYAFAASLPLDITSFWILDYTFGSKLWDDAHRNGAIAADECNVPAGCERGTSTYPSRVIEQFARQCFFRYYRRPAYWLRQAAKIFRVRDRFIVAAIASGIGWLVRQKCDAFRSYVRSAFHRKSMPGMRLSRGEDGFKGGVRRWSKDGHGMPCPYLVRHARRA